MEKLIYWFSRNHVAANFLMVIILLMGITTWGKLKKEIFPETAIDAVAITVPFPNASPEEVEKGIILPIEEAIADVEGVERITSTAAQGTGAVVVEAQNGYLVRNLMDDLSFRMVGRRLPTSMCRRSRGSFLPTRGARRRRQTDFGHIYEHRHHVIVGHCPKGGSVMDFIYVFPFNTLSVVVHQV